MDGWASRSRPRGISSTWAAARAPPSSNSLSPTGPSPPPVLSKWWPKTNAARKTLSAMWPSLPMAACSTPRTFIAMPSWWSTRNREWSSGSTKPGAGPTAFSFIPMANRSSSPTGPMGSLATMTPRPAASSIRCVSARTRAIWSGAGAPEVGEGQPAPYAARIFVAAANTNSVYAVAVTAAKELSVVESINIAMTPRQPLGMTPSGLGLAADGKRLFVACSDANAAAVVDISQSRSRVEGFIPTGWYPTAVRGLPSGTLVVLNGKGLRSYPNAKNGPNPLKRPEPVHAGEPASAAAYVGRIQTGTASWIAPFTKDQLDAWTKEALANSPYRDSKLDEGSPLPQIEHVIYIVKENRSYDQVLGDMKEGNGDASLTIFGESITPNLHKLAREFVLLDNFYVNSDVSADGHNWSTAAIAPDYVQKMWPNEYGKRRTTYDFEEQDPLSAAGGLSLEQRRRGRRGDSQLRLHGRQQAQCAHGFRTDHRRARSGPGQSHQPAVPRLRLELSRRGARQSLPGRTGRI